MAFDDDEKMCTPEMPPSSGMGYFYSDARRDGAVVSGGLFHGDEGQGVSADALNFDGEAGTWRDRDGKENHGVHAGARVLKFGVERGGALGPVGVDATALEVDGGVTVNDSTASIGGGATLGAANVTVGSQKNNVRLGLSAGPSIGARVHYGDADHNGIEEAGFGFDLGPVSFDVKSELLGRLADEISGPSPAEQMGFLDKKPGESERQLTQRYFDRRMQRVGAAEGGGGFMDMVRAKGELAQDIGTPDRVVHEVDATRALQAETARQVDRSEQIQNLVRMKHDPPPFMPDAYRHIADAELAKLSEPYAE